MKECLDTRKGGATKLVALEGKKEYVVIFKCDTISLSTL